MPVAPVPLGSEITLVPNSGIQFVTLPLNVNAVTSFERTFIERRFVERDTEGREVDVRRLLQGWSSRGAAEQPPNAPMGDDDDYDITKLQALEPFIGKWVPVPYLCVRTPATALRAAELRDGPTNWVRVRIVKAPQGAENGVTHLAVLAFDTRIENYDKAQPDADGRDGRRPPNKPYAPYTEPRAQDISGAFKFVSEMNSLDRILADPQQNSITGDITDHQQWLVLWLEELFMDMKRARRAPRPIVPEEDIPHRLEHVARWIAMLDLLQLAARPPQVRFIDTISEQSTHEPIYVDLILDIGNSRTCGMLIEDFPNSDVSGLSNTMTLALRDLSEPEKVYREPFESHIEFKQANFGSYSLSRQSRREHAFVWPSMVRVGREATRLRNAQDDGNESLYGMSSPKRYLWDVAEAVQPWRFPKTDYVDETLLPPQILALTRPHVNARGDVLSQVETDAKLFGTLYRQQARDWRMPGPQFTYSRSSMYTFMLAELIWQAFVSINNPEVRAQRKQGGVARQLRDVIITLPTAVPSRERRIMRSRARSAVNLLWEVMQWNRNPPPGTQRPSVKVMWDEASCGQMVWLYGEIAEKFGGIKPFFDLMGRPRRPFGPDTPPAPNAPEETSLRVASIDIGGGTTDLMITTYFQRDNLAIQPVQTFRESMRTAGDDVVKAVIETVLLPAITAHLRDVGVRDPIKLLRELFRGDGADVSVQHANRRRQFVQRVLQPAALSIMGAYEARGSGDYSRVETRPLADLVADFADIAPTTLDYLAVPAGRDAGATLDIANIPVPLNFKLVRDAAQDTLRLVLGNMCEAINHFDCDVVLLTGRPTRLPAIMDMVMDSLAVTPDRLIAMHQYRPGHWYPYLSAENARIADPKTTAVVGGTLCAVADRRIRGFMVFTDAFQMRSTARFIGPLKRHGELKDVDVLFTEADLSNPESMLRHREFNYFTEQAIGYRQLPFERWTATPLYMITEAHGGAEIAKPIRVSLMRSPVEFDSAADDLSKTSQKLAEEILMREDRREELTISDAQAPSGSSVTNSMVLALCTLDSNASYWLDTGILNV